MDLIKARDQAEEAIKQKIKKAWASEEIKEASRKGDCPKCFINGCRFMMDKIIGKIKEY